MCASQHSHFWPHADIGQINNADESTSFHINLFRDTTYLSGKTPHSIPTNVVEFHSNSPQNEVGFVDGHLGKKQNLYEKIRGEFINNSLAMSRRNIGIKNLSTIPTRKNVNNHTGKWNTQTGNTCKSRGRFQDEELH